MVVGWVWAAPRKMLVFLPPCVVVVRVSIQWNSVLVGNVIK